MKACVFVVLVSVAAGLTGCGVLQRAEDNGAYSVSAAPLAVTPAEIADAIAHPPGGAPAGPAADDSQKIEQGLQAAIYGTAVTQKQFLGAILLDSRQKCATFLNRISVAQNGVNATGDILTTVLSGVSTAVAPIAVSHGFSAASTIIGAGKSVLNADFWAKSGVQDFQKAIAASYGTSLKTYSDALEKTKDINIGLEVQKISSIHNLCSVASALNVIASTLASSAQPAAVVASQPGGGTSPAVAGASVQAYANAGSGFSQASGATLLRNFLHQAGLTAPERQSRNKLIADTAASLGFGSITVPAFIDDTSPATETQRMAVAKRLNLAN